MAHTGGGKAKLRRGRNQKTRSDQAGEPPQKKQGSHLKKSRGATSKKSGEPPQKKPGSHCKERQIEFSIRLGT